MNYEAIENDIISRLQARIDPTVVDIELLPETESELTRPVSKNRVTVAYRYSDFPQTMQKSLSEIRSTSSIVQNEIVCLEVVLRSRKLRGASGLYDLIEKVRKAILGFSPLNCDKIFITKYGFTEFSDSTWMHTLEIGCVSLLVEDNDVPNDPNSTEITVTSEDGESVVPNPIVGASTRKWWYDLDNVKENNSNELIYVDGSPAGAIFSGVFDPNVAFEFIIDLFGYVVSDGVLIYLDDVDTPDYEWNVSSEIITGIYIDKNQNLYLTDRRSPGTSLGNVVNGNGKLKITNNLEGDLVISYSNTGGATWDIATTVDGVLDGIENVYLKALFSTPNKYRQIKVTQQ